MNSSAPISALVRSCCHQVSDLSLPGGHVQHGALLGRRLAQPACHQLCLGAGYEGGGAEAQVQIMSSPEALEGRAALAEPAQRAGHGPEADRAAYTGLSGFERALS